MEMSLELEDPDFALYLSAGESDVARRLDGIIARVRRAKGMIAASPAHDPHDVVTCEDTLGHLADLRAHVPQVVAGVGDYDAMYVGMTLRMAWSLWLLAEDSSAALGV